MRTGSAPRHRPCRCSATDEPHCHTCPPTQQQQPLDYRYRAWPCPSWPSEVAAAKAWLADHRTKKTRQLSDLYDPDLRATDELTHRLAAKVTIPHPLAGITYADGTYWP